VEAVEFRDAVDDRRHVGPELLADVVDLDAGVLHGIVEERGGDGDVIADELGHDGGHRDGVMDVGLT
jgi:hypothetical protein